MSDIKIFTELKKGDTGIAGGKGASLGEMTQAGINVPPGYVVLTSAFDRFLHETDLTQEIAAILKTVDKEVIHTVDGASEQIQGLILSQEMPADIEKAIKKDFESLDSEFVAVRSSATAEDGLDHAWAGQLDSFLNVTEDTLLDSVKKCWASLFTPRAIFYRFEKELHDSDVSVAVVVQKMVNSEKSGIAFSVHPVTEDYDQLIIEAGLGLGEAIVSGSVTPDSYVVSKAKREAIDVNINEQSRALYRKEGGGNEWIDLGENGASQVLSEKEALELSEMIIRIEDHYGLPQDIEWAYESGEFFITQSRPITTLSRKSSPQKPALEQSDDLQEELDVLKSGNWEIDWDAQLSHFAVSITCQTYFSAMKDRMGHSFTGLFLTFKEGKILAYIDSDELNEFATNLLPKIDSLEKVAEWSQSFREISDRIVDELDDITVEKFIKNKDHYISLFSEYGTWQIATKAMYSILPSTWDKGIAHELEEARKYSEKFYKKLQIFEDLIGHIASENKYSQEAISALVYDEINEYFVSGKLPNEDMLIDRYKESSFYITQESTTVLSPAETEKVLEMWTPEVIDGQVKGMSAYGGKVQGRCRLITKFEGELDIDEGDVLVATMTDPNYIPLMSKAGAFVTDGGGMLCHAAIVAREMKKPCVIGTKIATQVLKDGDMVEVDADKGVVRILESGKKVDIKEDIETKEKWIIAAGDFNTPFIKNYCTALGYAQYRKEHGFAKSVGVLSKNRDAQYIVLPSTWENAHNSLKGILDKDSRYLEKVIEKIELLGSDLNQWTEKNFLLNDIAKLSNYQILDLLKVFTQKQSRLYTLGTVFSVLDYGEYKFVENNLNDIIDNVFQSKKNRSDVFEIFTTPTSTSFETEQELELLKLAEVLGSNFFDACSVLEIAEIKQEHPAFFNELEKHTAKWSWLYYSYMGPAYSEKDFLKILQDFAKQNMSYEKYHQEHVDRLNHIEQKKEEYIKLIKPSDFELNVLNLAEKMVWAKPRRKDYQSKSYYHLSFLFTEIANRLNISRDQVFDCSFDMIEKALMNKVSIDLNVTLKIRNLHIIIPSEDGTVSVYIGADAEKFCNKEIKEKTEQVSDVVEMKGSTAYKGKVTGVVRIINKPQEMEKMENGNVLVALATTPDIITAMKKASAIVTDKGGLTCHAAIVARELKTPTVVGVEIATQVLKDGDMVEVDADNGVVRILESADVSDEDSDLDPSDYQRMFAGKGFSVLMNDIFLKYYGPLGIVSFQDKESWMCMFPKAMQKETLKDGLKLYTSKKEYESYKKDFQEYIKNSKVIWQEILEKESVNTQDVEVFFSQAAEHFKLYSKTEFFYTDNLKHADMVPSIEEFDQLKLDGRTHLNQIIFEEDGYVKSFLLQIAKATSVSQSDLLQYTIDEIIDLVKKQKIVSEEILQTRVKGFFMSYDSYRYGGDAYDDVKRFFAQYREKSKVIKGTVANGGEVSGIARVLIPNANDFSKIAKEVDSMEKGEILVAETTSPDIIQACNKAAAIVTNQGGMLSHAAIVSRELGIPCIIGTDHDVVLNIKTGDTVEVDADNGVVRIIEK